MKSDRVSVWLASGFALGLFVAGGWPSPALAQAPPPVVVDQEALADRLFGGLLQIRDGGQDGLAHLLLSAELLEWRRQNPAAAPQDVAGHFAARAQALTGALTEQDRALPDRAFAIRVLKILVASEPGTASRSPEVRRLLDATLGKSVAAFDAREDLASGALRTAQWMRGVGEGESAIWAAVRRRASTDDGFAHAWNSVIGAPLDLDATSTFAQMKDDPTLNAYIDVDAILARQGSREEFAAETRRQFGLVMGGLLRESEQARGRLLELTITCPVSLSFVFCTEVQRAAELVAAREEQEQIDAGAASAKILGGLMAITDLQAGQKMEKVATAFFSIITAVNKYGTAVAKRSVADALLSASTIGLTGDVVGAVTTLVGLLADGGPTPDQQILEQVAALRNEVRALHEEMRASFERIQAQLNTIFDAMMTEFTKLDRAVAGNTAALRDIQNVLARQGLRLEEVAASILTAIGEVELHDARVDVNRYIGYLETFGQPIPTFGEYTFPEAEFHFAATGIATDSAFVVSPDAGGEPAVVLDNNGEAKSISYLARRGHARDARIPDETSLVANPGVWSFAAQAYMLLALQNPGYAAQVNQTRGDEIAQEGQRILDTARSFSRPTEVPDATGNRTNPVFVGLLQDYRAAVARLATAMAAVRTTEIVVRDEPGGSHPLARSYDLFGSADQALPASTLPPDPAALSLCTPGADNPSIARPSNVDYRSLAPELRFAHHAFSPQLAETGQIPELSQCYDVAWVNVRSFANGFERGKFGSLRLTTRTRFRWAPAEAWRNARSATYTWEQVQISRQCVSPSCHGNFNISPTQQLTDVWPSDSVVFGQSALVTEDAGLVSEARATMAAFLQGRQRALYYLLAIGIQGANTDLNRAANDMNNAVRQLQAYTRLGFPMALADDDILSSLLFGRHSIPSNTARRPQLDGAYGLAFNSYACTNSSPFGGPCLGGPFSPLRDQTLLETVGGNGAPVACAVPPAGVPGLPGDQVGDCLVASTAQRVDALAARYRAHSQSLAAGVYVEQLPWVSGTVETLPLVVTLVRTPPSN